MMRFRVGIYLSAAGAAAYAVPAWAQQLGGGQSPDISIWRILLALILCLMIALAVIWFVHQRQRGSARPSSINLPWLAKLGISPDGGQERDIEIVDMRKLNQQTDVCLLRCQSRDYFILLGSDGPVILHEEKTPLAALAAKNSDEMTH